MQTQPVEQEQRGEGIGNGGKIRAQTWRPQPGRGRAQGGFWESLHIAGREVQRTRPQRCSAPGSWSDKLRSLSLTQ